MMAGTSRHIINMANSIIGVSILSMPYCFKESGLVLGVLLILLSGFITKKTCIFLIKAAIMSRRRSYELLAFQVFGVTGKLLMELCMILFLIGICISFHVVMGDLAPSIVAKYMVIENSPSLRCTLLVGMMLLVILPLCLLRNLDSLASMSACSIGFYVFLTCIIFYLALPNLLDGSWILKAKLFQFDSAFRALPIMTLALSCQSNVFEIYDSVPDPDVIKMKSVVSQAVNICCALYIGVGFLGYVAFVDGEVGGNIIMSFPVSHLTDGITMFFVFSLAISFPLMLFPCRTSIHSLIYKRNTQISYDLVGNYMPESRFKGITLSVLSLSLVLGILLPNIEFVLGLLGSTMGVIIALILPSVFYIKVYTKFSRDRLFAQGFLLMGIVLMVIGTYLHLGGLQTSKSVVITMPPVLNRAPPDVVNNIHAVPLNIAQNDDKIGLESTGRKEPAIPEPPPNVDKEQKEAAVKPRPLVDAKGVLKKIMDSKEVGPSIDKGSEVELKKSEGGDVNPGLKPIAGNIKSEKEDVKVVKKDIKEEDLHPDAIKKEEKENAEEAQGRPQENKENIEKKQELILKQMEHQQKEQIKLIEEQKKILQELKDQKEKNDIENEIVNSIPVKDEQDKIPGESVNGVQQQQIIQNWPKNVEKEAYQPIISKNLVQSPPAQESINLNQQINQDNLKPIHHKEAPLEKEPKQVANGNLVNNVPVVAEDVKLSNVLKRAPVEDGVGGDKNDIKKEKPLVNHASSVSQNKRPEDRPHNQLINSELNKHYKVSKTKLEVKAPSGKLKSNVKDIFNDETVLKQHDEERRKRDLVSLNEELVEEENEQRKSFEEDEGGIQHSNRLSFEPNQNEPLKDEGMSKETKQKAADVLFETRHLLWVGRQTRRRKRRQEQFPEYLDEM